MVEWKDVAREFEFTGSWRDVCVFDTSMHDWQAVLDTLRQSSLQLSYLRRGEPTVLPSRAEDAFPEAGQADRLLSVQTAGMTLNCHFFTVGELEFDLDPRAVTGTEQLGALVTFMRLLADACGKPAVLTEENWHQAPILRTKPRSEQVEYFPFASGWQTG